MSTTRGLAIISACASFRGLSHGEIAEQLGLPLGTVKGRMRLAPDRLRTLAPEHALDVEGGA